MNGGADLVRLGLEARLGEALPPVLVALAAARGLLPGSLKAPTMTGPTEITLVAAGDFPACMVTVLDTPAQIESEGNEGPDGERDRRVRYLCRVFVFVRGHDRRAVADQRDLYGFALRACLAGKGVPQLAATVPLPAWREAYSTIDASRRTQGSIGGMFAEFTLTVSERW